MALNAYLTLRGKNQGDIDGPVTDKGLENTILIHSYTNQIVSPRDPASGLPTGPLQHQAIVLVKDVDQTSPLLWNAFLSNETLVIWQLNFWQANGDGTPATQIYTVKLTNAQIASINEYMNASADPTQGNQPLQQVIAFTYQKIEWIWTDGGITAEGDWETPNA